MSNQPNDPSNDHLTDPSSAPSVAEPAGSEPIAEPAGSEPAVSSEDGQAAASPPVIANLSGARIPTDRGISSLGLLMQLGGTIGVTLAAIIAISIAFSGGTPDTGVFFFFAILCGVRSAFHRSAGTALLYGKGSAPLRGMNTYLLLSLGQTIVCLMLIKNHFDAVNMAKMGALFIGWPLVLFIYTSLPHVKALLRDEVPDSEDHGFEGAAVLMTLFGIIGTLFAGIVLMYMLEDAESAFATPAKGIFVLVFMALLARSIIHALAGFKGISGADFDECNATASRYYNFGIASAVCIGLTLFVVFLMSTHHLGGALIVSVFSASMLLAWPNILRRLYSERNFNVYLAGEQAPTFQRAPDAGLIALGWTLVAVGVFSLGQAFVEALLAKPLSAEELAVLAMFSDMDSFDQLTRSAWWSVGTSGLQLWAGIEIVRMSQRHKLAAMIYGVVTTAVVVYVLWPSLERLDSVFGSMFGSGAGGMFGGAVTGAAGFNLVLAIGAMILVNRVAIPSAVVYIRKDKPAQH